MLPVAITRSFSDKNAIRYVLPVVDGVMFSHNGKYTAAVVVDDQPITPREWYRLACRCGRVVWQDELLRDGGEVCRIQLPFMSFADSK